MSLRKEIESEREIAITLMSKKEKVKEVPKCKVNGDTDE
jgi:hypothetical protein